MQWSDPMEAMGHKASLRPFGCSFGPNVTEASSSRLASLPFLISSPCLYLTLSLFSISSSIYLIITGFSHEEWAADDYPVP
jgi:hypothetical protein